MERIISQDFKETEIGPIPKDWVVVRLGDITEIKYGKSNPNISGNIPVVGSGGIYDYTSTPLVNFPTIVIGRKGTAGKTWLMEISSYPSDTTFYLIIKRELLLKFIYYYMLKYPLSGEHAKTTLPSLQKPDIENYYIPLPPLPEQKAIANVLSIVQENIEKTEAVISSTKELKKSLMNHLFTYGPVPITETEKVKLKETDIGLIPEEWKVVRLEEVGKIFTGTTPNTKKREYYGNNYMFISPGDMGKNKYIYATAKYLSSEGIKVSRSLPKNSILVVCIGATIGKTGMTSEDVSTTNQQINSIIAFKHIDPNYIYYSLSKRAKYLINQAGRAAVPIVNKSIFSKFEIVLSPLPIQKEIADILSAVDAKIEAEENKAKALEKLFQSLLNDLMTGKIRVREEVA